MGTSAARAVHAVKTRPGARLFWLAIAWPAGLVMWALTRLALATMRIEVVGPGLGHVGSAVFVNWHRYAPLLVIHHAGLGRVLLSSAAPYMEPVMAWERLLGCRLVRGATGEGGREAVPLLVAALRGGRSVFLAVDGPAGPPLVPKRGCVDVAREAGAPIIPVGTASARGRYSRSRWDRLLGLAFFDRVTITYGEPIVLGASEPTETALERVKAGLEAVCDSSAEPG